MDPNSDPGQTDATVPILHEDSVHQVTLLAQRLRESMGGDLDDDAIFAVAEATGAPVEYVRLAIQSLPEERSTTLRDRVKSSFLAFSHDVRRYVVAGILGTIVGLLFTMTRTFGDPSGLVGTVAILLICGMVWNSSISRSAKTAAISGGISAAIAFFMVTLFSFIFGLLPRVPTNGPAAGFILLFIPVGVVAGFLAFQGGGALRKTLGLKDPVKERHALLQQLLDIQDRLRSDEKFVTFLSLDIVGSTQIKTENDPLAVEFTFNEYHKYIESLSAKYSGRLHSTAGDGAIVAFDDPKSAFIAAKAVLAGMFEFNTFRNRTNKPIALRGGLHTGSVLAPGQDVASVNFAHVIDIAAHLQKVSPLGCLAVSETTATLLPGGKGSVGSESVEAQSVRALVWRPRSRVVPTAASL